MYKRTLVNLILVFTVVLTVGVGAVSAAPPVQEEMVYMVKVGDNLWALAEKYLGSGPAYWAIVKATNAKHEEDTSLAHIENPSLVHPGWKLLIPGAEEAPAAAPALATAAVVSNLSNQPGRAIVTARGNHFVIDSVPPLEGPNEEVNPLDAMLGALATCGIFVYEKAAEEQGIPLNVEAICRGDEPDVFLKPDDVLAIGTDVLLSWLQQPLPIAIKVTIKWQGLTTIDQDKLISHRT